MSVTILGRRHRTGFASNYSTATDEDTAISGGVLTGSVIAGEPGDSGDTLTYSGDSTSADGALVTVNANGTFSYDPTAVRRVRDAGGRRHRDRHLQLHGHRQPRPDEPPRR